MTKSMETYINYQIRQWEQNKNNLTKDDKGLSINEEKSNPFVIISREYGCGGFDIASIIIHLLNIKYKIEPIWSACDKEIIKKLSEDMGFNSKLANTLTNSARNQITNMLNTTFSNFPPQVTVYKKMAEIIRTFATNGNVIIVGRGGNVITKDMKNGLRIRIIAPLDWRIKNLSESTNISTKKAKKIIENKTIRRDSFFKEFTKINIDNLNHYHLVINNSITNMEEAASLIIEVMKIKGLLTNKFINC